MKNKKEIVMTIKSLDDLVLFVRKNKKVVLTIDEKKDICRSRKVLVEKMKTERVYGANTGVGKSWDVDILPKDDEEFQRRLILSHATNTGKLLERDSARGTLLLLINTLRKGFSGVSLETIEAIIDSYNSDIVPIIPERGSLGASGDLSPLSHQFLSLSEVKLKQGETIFLINGTHCCTSVLAFAVYEAQKIVKIADLAVAMTTEALQANTDTVYYNMSSLKEYMGLHISEENAQMLFDMNSPDYSPRTSSLQDAYSLKCFPHVHGGIRDFINFYADIVSREIRSISLNPVVFTNINQIRCGGNFHAHSIALAGDCSSVALVGLGGISQARIGRMLDEDCSNGLPPFLSSKPGINPGLMISGYSSGASLSWSKILSRPASVDSVSVSAGQEDFVSMAANATLKARDSVEEVRNILAVELLCASHALKFREVKIPDSLAKIRDLILDRTKNMLITESVSEAINNIAKLIKSGEILEALPVYLF
ncbi:aromatic amino acid ammonia-lyase [Patescibacteria group bacterium]|nr:aromatic amino acid ammonia-lyase [Patescibacteria group bacterium]